MNKKILFLGRESNLWLGLDEKQKEIEFKQGYSDEMSYVIDVMKKNGLILKLIFLRQEMIFQDYLIFF